MSLLNLKDLCVTLGLPLFSDLNLTLEKGDRIGLIAGNGRGKSTLLHCIAGTADITSGEITRARGLRVGHLQQEVPAALLPLTLYEAVLSALPPEQAEYESWRVDVVLNDLKVPFEHQQKQLSALSGGWQRIAMLARVWVQEPDLMLMDEPTNHLDLSRIGVLQSWLKTTARGVPLIIASHDRAFLDEVTNRTLFLRENASRLFSLPYSQARTALEEADAADARKYGNDIKQANQLRRQAAKLKNIGINSGSDLLITKTKQLKDRAERLETSARPAHQERSTGDIKLGNSGTHAKALVAFDDVEVATPDGLVLFKTGKVWINKGDRIVLLGANGTGKTRLISLLHSAITSEAAGIRTTPSIQLGYSDQGLSHLDQSRTALEEITQRFDIGDQRARGLLAGAGFSIDLQKAKLTALSGGQKMRLAMLILRLDEPNFYLLDEPTNHLDIEGQEALEDELTAHDATCLLVSHDRTFVREVGSRFWLIDGKQLCEIESPEAFFAQALIAEESAVID